MKFLLLPLLLLGCWATATAQTRSLPTDTTAFFADLTERTRGAINSAPVDYAEFFTDVYQTRDDDLREEIREGVYLFNDSLQRYVDGIFEEIASANGLTGDWLVLVRRSQRPNAFSMGDQIFALHLGILQQVETEEELAFVIAHELAHDVLLHQRTSMTRLAAAQPDFERKARKLSRRGLFAMRSDRKERLAEDLRTTIYGRYSQDREKELQADSLALAFISNTRYDRSAAARAVHQLADKDFFDLSGVDLDQVLTTDAYPFKEKWVRLPDDAMFGGSFGSGDDTVAIEHWWASDSVSTHPALEERQAVIDGIVEIDTTYAPVPHGWREFAIREALEYQLERKATGHALVNALLLHQTYPSEPRYEARIGQALLATHRSIVAHDFDEAVPPITYFRDDTAQAAVRMLRQMRKSELQKLTLAYLNGRVTAHPASVELKALLEEASTYFDSQD